MRRYIILYRALPHTCLQSISCQHINMDFDGWRWALTLTSLLIFTRTISISADGLTISSRSTSVEGFFHAPLISAARDVSRTTMEPDQPRPRQLHALRSPQQTFIGHYLATVEQNGVDGVAGVEQRGRDRHADRNLFEEFAAQSSQMDESDRQALRAFKAGVYADPYGALLFWNTSDTCDWQGVACDLSTPRRVKALSLANSALKGYIDPHLGNLTMLQTLDLKLNSFSGSIPQTFGKLARLVSLYLDDNYLTGSIPSSLGNCSQLKEFSASSNGGLSGSISPGFSSLEFLDLSGNSLSGFFPDLGGGSLRKVFLYANFLTGLIPASLANNSNLEVILMENNFLSGELPREIGWLKNLSLLAISDNKLDGNIPPSLSNCTALQKMTMMHNSLSGSIPEGIGDLKSLQSLYLGYNNLSGPIPPSLGNGTALGELLLQKNALSGLIPGLLGGTNCRLTLLDLAQNQLAGLGPQTYANCSSLTLFLIGENRLQGGLPPWLGQLSNMKTFSAESNQFTGGIPVELAGCTRLQILDLSGNSLDGELPDALSQLVQLQVISLRSNRFQGTLPSWLSNFTGLQALDLSHNRFSGPIPLAYQFSSFGTFGITSCSNSFTDNQYITVSSPDDVVLGYQYQFGPGESIDLSFNNLSGPIPSEQSFFTASPCINFSNNSLDGPIPEILTSYLYLKSLDLSNNQLSGSLPADLGNLNYLSDLHLAGNNLSGPIPDSGDWSDFSLSTYKPGNPGLCGPPLSTPCPVNSTLSHPPLGSKEPVERFISFTAFGVGLSWGFSSVAVSVFASKRMWKWVWYPKHREPPNYDREYGVYRNPGFPIP